MLIKNAIITALVTWALIIAIAVGVALYRHDVSMKGVLEYVWGTSFAFALLGLLFRSGAAKGDTIERTEGVVEASLDRDGYLKADSSDAIRGFAFGTIVMLSALLIFGASLAILHFSYPS